MPKITGRLHQSTRYYSRDRAGGPRPVGSQPQRGAPRRVDEQPGSVKAIYGRCMSSAAALYDENRWHARGLGVRWRFGCAPAIGPTVALPPMS